MIAELKALSVGQRIAGALIVLAVWLAPAAGVWLYMRGQLSAQFDLGKAEAVATHEGEQNKANAKALEDAQKRQAEINKSAAEDAERIAAMLAQARRAHAKAQREYNDHAKGNPLSADCYADPERVRLFNKARQGTGTAGARSPVR